MKKILLISLFLAIVDILVWYIVFYTPEPIFGDGLTILFIIILISVINLAIALLLLFISIFLARTSFANSVLFLAYSFLVNTILSFSIMFGLQTWNGNRISSLLYQDWEFSAGDNNYRITRYIYDFKDTTAYGYNPLNSFYISTVGDGWSASVENGEGSVLERNDTIFFFRVDSTTFFITSGYLYNFESTDSINVKKR